MVSPHRYLERLQRQLLELEQARKEGLFPESRGMSSGVVSTLVPKMFPDVNVNVLDSLEVSGQFVKGIVPLSFVGSVGDANGHVYTS